MDLIKPAELDNDNFDWTGKCRNSDIWQTLTAARNGDLDKLTQLISTTPALANGEYWYTPPLHFATREGHLECVKFLVEHGADISHQTLFGQDNLVTVASDRNQDAVAEYLTQMMREQMGASPDVHSIHQACADSDTELVDKLLAEQKDLVDLGDSVGRRPLHYAVENSNRELIELLLKCGASVDLPGFSSDNRVGGYGFRPIVSALWKTPYWSQRNDYETVQLLLRHGAEYTITVAAALGDEGRVRALLSEDLSLCNHQEGGGKRAISAAAERNHEVIVDLLLNAGNDPNLEEGVNCPRGFALWAASRFGYFSVAKRLLKAGADPNAMVESSGNPTESAINKDMRNLLYEHGGQVGRMQIFHENNVDVVAAALQLAPERFTPDAVADGYTMAVSSGHRTIVKLMLNAGLRLPSVVTGCQTYLWQNLELAEELLKNEMDPNLPNWQQMRPLHHMAQKGHIEEAKLFIRYGANPSFVDEEFRSTPLGWAARFGQLGFAQMLLEHSPDRQIHEPPGVPDWATPLAWATKKEHSAIVQLLNQ